MRIRLFTAGVAAFALLAPLASAAQVSNGDFEKGDFRGWDRTRTGPAKWILTSDENQMHGRRGLGPPPPLTGHFSALAFQDGPGRSFMSHTIKLPPQEQSKLKFKLAYELGGDDFVAPNGFSLSHPNEQLRVDVLRGSADIDSSRHADVLAPVLQTQPGDPAAKGKRTYSVNLTPFAGKTVNLRYAVVVTEEELSVRVDDVKVKSKHR